MAAQLPNVSQDLVWELTRTHNSFIVKRKGLGNSIIFSRDPYNLTNVHSKKHAGYAHDKSISVQAGENGAIQVVSKNEKKVQKPAEARNVTSFSQQAPARKTYKAVANLAARRSYRSDLRQSAVERVSALRYAQKAVKADPEQKLRGKKAKKAAAADES
ncbi:hypothetical protein ACHAQA_001114 [Verticillium albo-atrum]